MARGPEYIVETDFIFGLRQGDRLHDHVSVALERNLEGEVSLCISGVAPIEANAAMASQGICERRIGAAFLLINKVLEKNGIESYTKVTVPDMELALNLRQKGPSLTFFDSLHAAISKRTDIPILSSDPIYDSLDVTWTDLQDIGELF